jgi:hypothetical protein
MNNSIAEYVKFLKFVFALLTLLSLVACQHSRPHSYQQNNNAYSYSPPQTTQAAYRQPQPVATAQRQAPNLRTVDMMISEAKAACEKFEQDIKNLKKKLGSKKVGPKARKIINEDIQIKNGFISAVSIISNRLSDKRVRLAYSTSLVQDLDRYRRIIDDRFLSEIDDEIKRLNTLLKDSPVNVKTGKSKR